MKKIAQFLSLLLLQTKKNLSIICMMLLISSCKDCKQCKTYTQYETAPVILEYFGNYKPGNYWIYENQDGTKRDSMWVSDYVERKLGVSSDCSEAPTRAFLIHTDYWGKSSILKASIDNGGNCCISKFRCYDTISEVGIGIDSENFKELSTSEIKDRFVSNVGIRKYYSSDLKDTFLLFKYFIK